MKRPKITVVMPAYNVERTLEKTYNELPKDKIDLVILVDDGSSDNTAKIACNLGLKIIRHGRNYGYGASQKTAYQEALRYGADIIVMLHPDYQHNPKFLSDLIRTIERKEADIVLGSRFLYGKPLKAGMPVWRYLSNRFLTSIENLILGLRLSEYHTGYRAYSRFFLESVVLAQ